MKTQTSLSLLEFEISYLADGIYDPYYFYLLTNLSPIKHDLPHPFDPHRLHQVLFVIKTEYRREHLHFLILHRLNHDDNFQNQANFLSFFDSTR